MSDSNMDKHFREFMEHLQREIGDDLKHRSQNPRDYPFSCQITDSDAILMIFEMKEFQKRLTRILDEASSVKHTILAIHHRLGIKLDDLYPDVSRLGEPDLGGSKWTQYGGEPGSPKFWFCSWLQTGSDGDDDGTASK